MKQEMLLLPLHRGKEPKFRAVTLREEKWLPCTCSESLPIFGLKQALCLPTVHTKLKVKVAQSCLTLYDPMDYTVHGILQARILE